MTPQKKLIEVALPLEAINVASAREKSIRHGHPSTLHLWWARRPLAAARAVIFAQMVDDPSAHPDLFPTEKKQEKERQRLFRIIEDLVKWENTTNETVLQQARDEIWQSWRHTCAENADHPRAKELFDRYKLPAFHEVLTSPPNPLSMNGEGAYRFTVKVGKPKDAEGAKLGTTAGKRAAFRCLMSGVPITYDHIREEGKAGRMGARLMAIVAEGERGRVYLAPTPEMEAIALTAQPTWKPETMLPVNPRDFQAAELRAEYLRRPLHPPPTRGADDLLRSGAGSARAGEERLPRIHIGLPLSIYGEGAGG